MSEIDQYQSNDCSLLQQIAEDSEKAFDILFTQYWEMAFSIAYKRLKDKDAAKDIVQEIFASIWANRHKIKILNFKGYLNVAIRNNVIKFIAHQNLKHPFFNILEFMEEKKMNADSHLLWKEFLQSYENILSTLPPKRQMIFRLRYQEDLPTNEICSRMGISRKTVQNQLAKAIHSIKSSFLHQFLLVSTLFKDFF